MNILAKMTAANILGAVALGAITWASQAKPSPTAGLPEISAITSEVGVRIEDELRGQLTTAMSLAKVKPVRPARESAVVITEGNDIVSEEVIVRARRLPRLDGLVSAAEAAVAPVRF